MKIRYLFMSESAWVNEEGLTICPSDIGEEASVVVNDLLGLLFFKNHADGLNVGLELVKSERFGSFLDHEIGRSKIDGVFDPQPINEASDQRCCIGLEVECDEAGLFKKVVVGEFVASQCSMEFPPFFRLVALFGEPGSWHIFEEFKHILAIFGEKDVRLAASSFKVVFLLEIGGRL